MGHAAPPTPSTHATPIRVVGYFLLGAVAALLMSLVWAFLGGIVRAMHFPPKMSGSLVIDSIVGATVVLIFLIALSCFALLTFLLFKARGGASLAYAAGAFTPGAVLALRAIVLENFVSATAWIVLGLTLLLAARVSARRGTQAHLRKFRVGVGRRCAHCHYDLSATAENQVCPECGGTLRSTETLPKPGA